MLPNYNSSDVTVPTTPHQRSFSGLQIHHQKPQLDTMLESSEKRRPNEHIYTTAIVSVPQEITEEGAERLQKPKHQEGWFEAATPGNGCINETRIKATSIYANRERVKFCGIPSPDKELKVTVVF